MHMTSEILVWRAPLHPWALMLGAGGQRSIEIQPGEIPTFLKEHTAPSSSLPFRPLGSNRFAGLGAVARLSLRFELQLQHAGCCR
jgi:hypothetical protein